jgi:asparagine synthase (glutamine-hydrolysing)
MCGIGGTVDFASRPDEDIAAGMCRRMAHRGPDAEGVYASGPALLAHTRLSIIDLTDAGAQPMSTPDGDVHVVFNGEIYNYPTLRAELDDYDYRSETDTEVILACYEAYGLDFLSKLRGMFAFGLWDEREERLLLARDRLGQKPLFYRRTDDGVVFGSTISAILADDSVSVTPDYEALRSFLTYQYVPHPKTGFEGIERLGPGEYMVIEEEGTRHESYWSLSFADKLAAPLDDIEETLTAKLRDAVSVRTLSDVPLGVFLSGGIDSTVVTHLMDDVTEDPVNTYSIGFDTYDELDAARHVAEEYGTNHHEYTVEPDAVEVLPEVVREVEMPFGDPSAVPTYYVSEMASQDITVAVGGDAGDENFAGYDRYTYDRATSAAAAVPTAVRRPVGRALAALPDRLTHDTPLARLRSLLENAEGDAVERYAPYVCHMLGADAERVWDGNAPADELAHLRRAFGASDGPTRLDRILQTDVETYLPDDLLVKVDRMGMAHSLEVRSPFLDHELVEFAARIPSTYKWRRGEKKWILKRTFRDRIPDRVLDRPKQGFSVPVNAWFRGPLASTAEEKLSRLGERDHFDGEGLTETLDAHRDGRADNGFYLWDLVVLETWFEEFVD